MPSVPAKFQVPEMTITCGEVDVRYDFSCAMVVGYTGVVVPPPVAPDAKPMGVPLTSGEMARFPTVGVLGMATENGVRSASM